MNEVVKKDETQVPAFLADYSGPTGLEGVDSTLIAIPFLKLAQQLTPQCNKRDPGYIEGLEPGMYFNPATRRIYGNHFRVVILGFYQMYTEWDGEPPASRFCGQHTKLDYEKNIAPDLKEGPKGEPMWNNHRIVDTRNFILMPYDSPEDGVLIYALSSSGIPASKKWLAAITGTKINVNGKISTAPLWGIVWEIASGEIKGDKGTYSQLSQTVNCGYIASEEMALYKPAFDEYQAYEKSKIALADDAPAF